VRECVSACAMRSDIYGVSEVLFSLRKFGCNNKSRHHLPQRVWQSLWRLDSLGFHRVAVREQETVGKIWAMAKRNHSLTQQPQILYWEIIKTSQKFHGKRRTTQTTERSDALWCWLLHRCCNIPRLSLYIHLLLLGRPGRY